MKLKTVSKKVFILLILYYCYLFVDQFVYFFLFIFIHEVSHYISGWLLGYTYSSVGIIPFGIYLRFKQEFIKPLDDIIISLSGPLINFVFFAVFYFISKIGYNRFDALMYINLLLGLFNLLPVSFLDGGRILKSLLLQNVSFYLGYKIINYNGFAAGFLMLLLSFAKKMTFSSFVLIALGYMFIINSYLNQRKETYNIIHDSLQKSAFIKTKKRFAIKALAYSEDVKVLDIIKNFCFNKYCIIHVIKEGNIYESFTEFDIINIFCNNGNITITDYMKVKEQGRKSDG